MAPDPMNALGLEGEKASDKDVPLSKPAAPETWRSLASTPRDAYLSPEAKTRSVVGVVLLLAFAGLGVFISLNTPSSAVVVMGMAMTGLILGGWTLGAQIKATRLGDRYVAVRGLSERTVKSNLAIWPIDYKEAGDDLPSLYTKTEADRKVILQFLADQGVQPSEIELGVVRVVDNQANEYGNGNRPPHRYIIQQQITAITPRVDEIAAGAQKTAALLQQGIVLNSNRGVAYKFTELNSVKPDMITEATRSARAAADRFAMDSGSKVGSIRQATQGIFSILPANSGGDADEGGGYGGNADSSIMKTVRVVTSVQYYLEK